MMQQQKKKVDNGLNSKMDKTLSTDLDLNNNKINNLKKATQNKDAVNLEQLNESASVISATTERLFYLFSIKKIMDIALTSDDNDASNKKNLLIKK